MKNKILITITIIAALIAAVTVCAIDTNSPIITGTLCACLGWLAIFAYANFRDWESE
ncbi:MAG: hypothetical protein LUC83_09970 [Clostridiales bacterium]|nr:hypothetical protein [Clostridiales bacterium]